MILRAAMRAGDHALVFLAAIALGVKILTPLAANPHCAALVTLVVISLLHLDKLSLLYDG